MLGDITPVKYVSILQEDLHIFSTDRIIISNNIWNNNK